MFIMFIYWKKLHFFNQKSQSKQVNVIKQSKRLKFYTAPLTGCQLNKRQLIYRLTGLDHSNTFLTKKKSMMMFFKSIRYSKLCFTNLCEQQKLCVHVYIKVCQFKFSLCINRHLVWILLVCAWFSVIITWPTMGFLQAPQTPLATVWTPSLLRSDCRLPSMLSSLLAGLGGPVGEVFPWDWIWWRWRTKVASVYQSDIQRVETITVIVFG